MKYYFSTVGWVMIGLAVVVSFGLDWANTAQGGAVDFRNRIVGARLLANGLDPYHYKWRPGDPPEYCFPLDNPKRPVTATSVTPALLLLQLPLAHLTYRLAQFLWLFGQWLLLLGIVWLWLRACKTSLMRLLVALIVVGFSFTASWRLHAERGQCYVLLTFFFAYWLTTTLDARRGNGFLAGCVAGFLVALRPPFLLLMPFLLLHRRGQLPGAVTGLLLGFGLPMLLSPICWTDYFSAMQTFSDLYRNGIHPSFEPQIYPPTIDGVPTELLRNRLWLPAGNFSVHSLLLRFAWEPFPALPPLLALAAAFALWLWWSREQPVERLLLGVAAWFFLADLFLPAPRESYNDALILNVIAAGLVILPRFPLALWPSLLALPLGAGVYFLNLHRPELINLPAALFTLSAILFLFWFKNAEIEKPHWLFRGWLPEP